MAKRKKNEPREAIQLPPPVTVALLATFTLLALLGGLSILWQMWSVSRAGDVAPQLETLRDALVARIAKQTDALRERVEGIALDSYLQADVAAGDFEGAAGRISEAAADLKDVGVYEPSLETVFSADVANIGFGKLSLLTGASNTRTTKVDVVGRGDALDVGIAVPVKDSTNTLLAVAYGAVPLDVLIQPVRDAPLPGGYLELRSGQRVLIERGDASLHLRTAYADLSGIPVRIGTAAPEVIATLPYSTGTQILLGLGALLLAGILGMKLPKAVARMQGKAVGVAEPTFADALRGIEGEKPEVAPPARKEAQAKQADEPATKPDKADDKTRARPTRPKLDVVVDRSIFRAYDIRGVLGKTLDAGVAHLIGQAIGTVMGERGLQEIVVGRDGRLSGPGLAEALIGGLRSAGRDVIDIGQAPTPVIYFASYQLQCGSCVAVTGSHNPPDYNGFKIVLGGQTLAEKEIEDLYLRIADQLLDDGGNGGLQEVDVASDYLARIADDVQLERQLRVVVDAGNGVAGAIAPQVLEAIGADVVQLYCEVDGDFPNHHPDPSDPENLKDLIHFVEKFQADIGLAFDGDGDRLGVVTRSGEIVFPDRLLMLFARDVLGRNPGATIIYDVKCTGHLAGQILRNGGSPVMWKTGHSLIKAKMRETEAELAGEMSGHFFFRERWYGFDDGIYSAARLLEILAADGRDIQEIIDELPKSTSTPELKVPMQEGAHYAFIKKFVASATFEGARISSIDGLRADWPDGWGLVRCSNTTPCLVLRFEGDDEAALRRIQDTFRAQLLAIDAGLALPF